MNSKAARIIDATNTDIYKQANADQKAAIINSVINEEEDTKKKLIEQLEAKRKELSKLRDELSIIKDEIDTESDCVEEALENLTTCIDKLSENQ